MLVSHRHKFIYTKTVKTGGTSVESYFERFCMPEGEWTQDHHRNEYVSETGIVGFRGPNPPANCSYWNHMPAELIRQRVGEAVWNEYFKFCVVRNPFEKAVSAFYFFQRSRKQPGGDFNIDTERKEFEAWLHHAALPTDRDKYLIDGKFCLDSVIRHESLAADMAQVCQRLGLAWNPELLPTFKAGIRPKQATVGELYTEKSRKIVETVYASELEFFNYGFPAGGQ